jgi:hypothetical protein
MTITTTLLLSLFASLSSTAGKPPDVCDVVYRDTGRPIICEPHREGAPVYDSTVCCDGQTCIAAQDGYCGGDRERFYCELGEAWATGEVSCYFEVPDYCDVFPCAPGFQPQPVSISMCCNAGVCWTLYGDANDCELGDIYFCHDGVTNEDGTVTCFDE